MMIKYYFVWMPGQKNSRPEKWMGDLSVDPITGGRNPIQPLKKIEIPEELFKDLSLVELSLIYPCPISKLPE